MLIVTCYQRNILRQILQIIYILIMPYDVYKINLIAEKFNNPN